MTLFVKPVETSLLVATLMVTRLDTATASMVGATFIIEHLNECVNKSI